ncbi:hypothetical protein CRUP_021271, partial [Coryphaenoides rupestris]
GLALGMGDTWGVRSCPLLLSPPCSRCTICTWFCNSASDSNFTLQLVHRVLAVDNEDVEEAEDADEAPLPFPSPGLMLSPWTHEPVIPRWRSVAGPPCCLLPSSVPPWGLELLEPAAVTQDAQRPYGSPLMSSFTRWSCVETLESNTSWHRVQRKNTNVQLGTEILQARRTLEELLGLMVLVHVLGDDIASKHWVCCVHLFLTSIVAVPGLHYGSSPCSGTMTVSQEPLKLNIFFRLDFHNARRRAISTTVLGLALKHTVFLPQVFLQQDDGVEGLAAEAAVVLLAVGCDVALQLHFRAKGLATEDAAVGTALVLQVTVFDMQLQVRLMPEVPVARGAAVDLFLIAVFHGEMELRGDLGVEHLLAQGAAEKHKRVHVKEVLLEVIHRGELRLKTVQVVSVKKPMKHWGQKKGIALLGHRTWETMEAANVLLEGIKFTHHLRAEVTLKQRIGEACEQSCMVLCIVHLLEVLIEVE